MNFQECKDVLAQLDRSCIANAPPIWLGIGKNRIKVLCAEPLNSELRRYFRHAIAEPGPTDAVVEVLEGQNLMSSPEWVNWARDPGKTGRKDAIHDLEDGRLVGKVRTGVTFLQSPQAIIAFGPCAQNSNQIVNFINTQFLNMSLRDGWQICHAAAITNGTQTLAIAGLSGGGKSTSVLRLMELSALKFMTNDRLLARAGQPFPDALGIPKEPRINPGTILHNPRLRGMLSEQRLAELSEMAGDDLWHLEEKYDLIISDVFGAGRVQYDAPLTDFWVLNWNRESTEATRLIDVDLSTRPDLLSAIMKSPGPFYQKTDGSFSRDTDQCSEADYLQALQGVRAREVTGRIDFDTIFEEGKALFETGGQDQ